MASDSVQLVGQGLLMGMIHVLTGPDHLSALATLSANIGNCKAFAYGARWGLGHSVGLVVMASVLIAISEKNEEVISSEMMDRVLETCVGVLMIALGCYGWYRTTQKQKKQQGSDAAVILDDSICLSTSTAKPKVLHKSGSMTSMNLAHMDTVELNDFDMNEGGEPGMSITDDEKSGTSSSDKVIKKKKKIQRRSSLSIEYLNAYSSGLNVKFVNPVESESAKNKYLACGMGIVQGVAGTGGVLGVLPAVKLREWEFSLLYLSFFCLSSILTMGIFAAFYGGLTKFVSTKAKSHLQIEYFSSYLSVFVGITWLHLLARGKLSDLFP